MQLQPLTMRMLAPLVWRERIGKIPLTTLIPLGRENGHRILVFYGGDRDAKPSLAVLKHFAPPLTEAGYIVHLFEHRDKIHPDRHSEFGLYDRIADGVAVAKYLLNSWQWATVDWQLPLTLLGVSMGGFVAVKTAIDPAVQTRLRGLVLVAPAAYHDDACQPDVKFGPATQAILRRPLSWQNSSVFQQVHAIQARTLILAFEQDTVVGEIPQTYYTHLWNGYQVGTNPRPDFIEFRDFPHQGNFVNPKKRSCIFSALHSFLLQPS